MFSLLQRRIACRSVRLGVRKFRSIRRSYFSESGTALTESTLASSLQASFVILSWNRKNRLTKEFFSAIVNYISNELIS